MTLFEAIRVLKPGQEIVEKRTGLALVSYCYDGFLAYPCTEYHLGMVVEIRDLPKLKIGLEDGLAIVLRPHGYRGEELQHYAHLALLKLRELPINWQAEVEREAKA